MEWIAFIISLVALGFSALALRKTGGLAEMKKEGESLRKRTADLLDRLEKKVRGEEKTEGKKEEADPDKKEAGPL
jgi:hypothetical protein